ncbi:MAG TPA: prepilin-type N-terminal cleavage/methylation domain-containing protein [Verrucomicrobiae bacterium]|jgi:prepilin-type N-terminal cleavage/methylation domain-containing protein
MKINATTSYARRAFTLIEVAITCAIIGIIFAGFYAAIGSGFSLLALTRENLRADQIMLDKMETLRLYSWSQINSNGFVPPTFTAPFFPAEVSESGKDSGVLYYGTLEITDPPFEVNYTNTLKLVTVTVSWTNGLHPRTRSMETLVSEFGIQNYVY